MYTCCAPFISAVHVTRRVVLLHQCSFADPTLSIPHASSPSGNGHNNGLSTSPTNPTSPINKESGRALDDAPPKLDDAAPKSDDEPPKSPVAQSAVEVGGD